MRVQIHYNELRPLIKEGYEKVYDAMSRLLAPEEMIFAKWEAGFGGILQWTLPNDYTWRNFTQGDNYDKQAVINEFMRLKAIGEKKLGTNERLKQAVYSIPSEASVYYTVTHDGKYHVMLTAWGYSFPTQAPLTDITWQLPAESQDTTVRFIENGKPMVNLPFDIHRNGIVLHHQLDEKGEKYFGKLTPGSELYIEVPSLSRRLMLTVVPGQTVYTFDMTTAEPRKPHAAVDEPEVPETPEEETEETEEIICGERTIKIQFIGWDGKADNRPHGHPHPERRTADRGHYRRYRLRISFRQRFRRRKRRKVPYQRCSGTAGLRRRRHRNRTGGGRIRRRLHRT